MSTPTDLQWVLDKLALVRIKGDETSVRNMREAKERLREVKVREEAEAAPAPAPSVDIGWGARMNGSVYGEASDAPWNATAWDKFESHTGKRVTFVHLGQPWGALDTTALTLARNRGALSVISIDTGSTTLAAIASGLQDGVIDAWANKARTWGYSFLVRPWWEMNGNWYSWGRKPEYIRAWQRFVSRVRAIAPNVLFVWCPNVGYDEASWAAFGTDPNKGGMYPGDAYVDWVGMDGYNRGTNPLEPDRWKMPFEVFGPTYQRLQSLAPSKPIMICETASTEYGGSKANWITALLGQTLPGQMPNVKALIWFNWNISKNGGKLDWPIESSSASQEAFKAGIASSYYRAP